MSDARAVECVDCGQMGRSDEMEWFDYGNESRGWICESCKKLHEDLIEDAWAMLQSMRGGDENSNPITFES